MKIKSILLILFIAYSSIVFSQNAHICGKVIDEKNATALPGAVVILASTNGNVAVQSDIDGYYCFKNLKPGFYSLKCNYVSYKESFVEKIEVKSNEVVTVDIVMQLQTKEITEVYVTAQAQNKNETAIVLMQKKSISLLNGISAENFSRMGDSDAASAIKRVTGVSVEGGKYVFVRGLSDRYSKIVLNSTEIPGLDPQRNTVQLDLFSTNIIDNIMVQKTYSADLPGSFGGGYINISTKSFPSKLSLQVSSSLGYNPHANLIDDFLTYQGGKTDWLGFDDGTRDIPILARNAIPYLYQNNDKLDQITKSFNKIMYPETKKSFLNQSHSLSFANQYKIGNKQLGVIIDLLYSKEFKYYSDGLYSRYQLNKDPESIQYVMHPLLIENEKYGDEDVIYSTLLGLSLKLNNFNKISLNIINNGGGLSNTRVREGSKINDDMMIIENTLGYQQRNFITTQLNGYHILNTKTNSKLNWIVSLTKSSINEPDLRFFNYDYDSTGGFHISYSAYPAPARFYRNLYEYNYDNKLNFVIPKQKYTLKYGFSYTYRFRDSDSRKFEIMSQGLPFNGNIAEYLSDQNIGQNAQNASYGVYYENDTINDRFNSYQAYENLAASYLLIETNLTTKLMLQFGIRYEFQNIFVQNKVVNYHPKYVSAEKFYLYDFLPSINLNYSLSRTSNFRIGLSRTLARPTFKEIAPYAYYDFKEGWRVVGNPNLERTLINNVDLRYEIYLANNQLFSISAFYKYFNKPIELVDDPRANNTELHYINIDKSDLYGIEVELRKDLSFLKMNNVLVGGNFTYIKSQVKYIEEYGGTVSEPITRPMYGQAPWVVNLFVWYDNHKAGLSTNLAFNIDGKKLAVVTKGATPDVYTMPVPSLNWNISKQFSKIILKASVSNILNSYHKKTYEYDNIQYIFQNYKLGRTYSLSVKYILN